MSAKLNCESASLYMPPGTIDCAPTIEPNRQTKFAAGDIIGDIYEVLPWPDSPAPSNVYRVRHGILNREYALKTFSHPAPSKDDCSRFTRKAQALARINHPNIVKILDIGHHRGTLPFFVMELLDGKSLKAIIKEHTRLEVGTAIGIAREISEGLNAIHALGIVHGAIKPSNIIILDGDRTPTRLKLVAFGVSDMASESGDKDDVSFQHSRVVGTPYYLSPEQIEGKRQDGRSDIYSLGCTLHEMLTGRPPLRGRNCYEAQTTDQPKQRPSLATVCSEDFAPEVEKLVATLLEENPAKRYQCADVLARHMHIIRQKACLYKLQRTALACQPDQQPPAETDGARAKTGADAEGKPQAKRSWLAKLLEHWCYFPVRY